MKIGVYTLTNQRDKFIDHLLAEKLRQYGHTVLIRNFVYGARESVYYEKPDVIVVPFPGGQYKYDFVKLCKKWGIVVIVRRGEAGQGREQFEKLSDDYKTVILGNWDYSPYVDLELTWGQEFSDIIAEQSNMPAEKIKACGAFAFDPYFQPDHRRNENHEKTILFATGFSTADCRSEYCETGLPEESDYHEKLYAIHRKARDKWIDAIKKLVKWFSLNWRFELKVRPGESVAEYKKMLPDCVKIHPEDTPSSIVLCDVDVLVHSGSTMAIEAHLLGIPSFNFCNVNPDPLLSMASPRLETYEELEWNLARAVVGQSNINESVFNELQEHLYGTIDGKACERAAKYIHEYVSSKKIKTKIPNSWPKKPTYLVEGVHLKQQEGDVRWTCPCCRNIYYGPVAGILNCPWCSMKIERTPIRPETERPAGKIRVTRNLESVLK